MQVVLAAIYIAVLYFIGELDTAIKIPFTSIEWIMPIWLYIPFVMFVVVGVVNAVNLTDGLDGLASSITTIVGIFFMLVSYIVFKEYGVTVFSAALIGGLIGFCGIINILQRCLWVIQAHFSWVRRLHLWRLT